MWFNPMVNNTLICAIVGLLVFDVGGVVGPAEEILWAFMSVNRPGPFHARKINIKYKQLFVLGSQSSSWFIQGPEFYRPVVHKFRPHGLKVGPNLGPPKPGDYQLQAHHIVWLLQPVIYCSLDVLFGAISMHVSPWDLHSTLTLYTCLILLYILKRQLTSGFFFWGFRDISILP